MLALIAIIVLSYFVGSIPTAIIISKKVKGIDIREHGSGNAGGTNVFRVLGWKYGVGVILLDACKALIAVLLVAQLAVYSDIQFSPSAANNFMVFQLIAGIAAILGHVWSIFANFRGGKGIATALGMLLAITTIDMLIAIGVFIIVVYIWRYVSLGSILGAVTIPLIMFIRHSVFHAEIRAYGTLLPILVAILLLVVYTHRKNIIRLLNGSENKIRFSRSK